MKAQIASRLFEDMDRIAWDALTPAEKSRQYSKWLADPEVGGRLDRFISSDRARVWLKDGPVKERARAQAGIGAYARAGGTASVVETILAKVLGGDWEPVEGSVRSKPLRFAAEHRVTGALTTVAWGPPRDVKHLVWAAVVAKSSGDANPWQVVLATTSANPVGAQDRQLHNRIAALVDVRIDHVELR